MLSLRYLPDNAIVLWINNRHFIPPLEVCKNTAETQSSAPIPRVQSMGIVMILRFDPALFCTGLHGSHSHHDATTAIDKPFPRRHSKILRHPKFRSRMSGRHYQTKSLRLRTLRSTPAADGIWETVTMSAGTSIWSLSAGVVAESYHDTRYSTAIGASFGQIVESRHPNPNQDSL